VRVVQITPHSVVIEACREAAVVMASFHTMLVLRFDYNVIVFPKLAIPED